MTLTKNDLLVLGFLLERPMHGYEIAQSLKGEDVSTWFEISTAAIYYSLNKLSRLRMVSETRAHASGGDRTIYHVTDRGRDQFFAEMQALLASKEPIRTEYDLGIFMLNRLPQERAAELLERRIEFLREWRSGLLARTAEGATHPLQRAVVRHAAAIAKLDIEWLSGLIDEVRLGEACEATFQGLMTLQGDLKDHHLPDLIKLIASGKHSGTLKLSSGQASRTLTFQDGRPHCTGSQVSGVPVIDPDKVLKHLYELFRWQQGTYVFDQRGCPQEGCVLLEVSAKMLILQGARRLDAWDLIERMVPASDAVFEPTDVGLPSPDLTLCPEEKSVLSALDGIRDIAGAARKADLTEFETSKTLHALYLVDLVQPADPDKGRLRRVFREFAELMCRGALPYRTSAEEAEACEDEVNRRCQDLPVSISDSHIVDNTDLSLQADDLASIYRRFLRTQYTVLSERLGQEIADELQEEVLSRISPVLRETLETYALL